MTSIVTIAMHLRRRRRPPPPLSNARLPIDPSFSPYLLVVSALVSPPGVLFLPFPLRFCGDIALALRPKLLEFGPIGDLNGGIGGIGARLQANQV